MDEEFAGRRSGLGQRISDRTAFRQLFRETTKRGAWAGARNPTGTGPPPARNRPVSRRVAGRFLLPYAMRAGTVPGIEDKANRDRWVRHGLRLATLTVAWNIIEGIVAVVSGLASGSVALVGFGIDSFIETASAAIVWWRFSYEAAGKLEEHAERAEAAASRATGALLLLLGGYLVFESGRRLMGFGREPETSGVGIILTAVSLVVMPVLARAKLRTAGRLGSGSLRADAYESIACAWLSVTTLAGLLLNAGFGWWWADPLAAFALVPLIVREGLEGVKGEAEEER